MVKQRILTAIFLILAGCNFTPDKKEPTKNPSPLFGLHHFDVIVLFSPYENLNQEKVYTSLSDFLKKIGSISVSQKISLFEGLLQDAPKNPVCFFTLGKRCSEMEVSLEVLTEVKILLNQQSTFTGIWKRKAFSSSPVTSSDETLKIIPLVNQLLEDFKKEYFQANSPSTQPTFDIFEFKEL
jgi:hypothetical protein